jgi:rare lipoprotein A
MSCQQARAYKEQGFASWYGQTHHGLKTASGQRFNMNALTAAHRQLPFGTKIRVTNIDAGTSVVLTVNDRGPFVANRILDVSYRGARDLGFVQSGTATVRIETVETC